MKSNKQHSIIKNAKKFVDEEIRPYANEFENQQYIPIELIKKMGSRGYLAASFPEEFGGLNLNALDYGCLVEEIGKGALSAAMLLTVTTGLVGETIIRWGTNFQKEHYVYPIAKGEKIGAFALTEPLVGSNAKDVMTTFEKKGDKYILNGIKKWISFGAIADFFIIIAVDKSKNASAFIVNRDQFGVKTKKMNGLLSCAASQIAEIELKCVEVNSEQLLGREGMGFTGIVNFALDNGRYNVAWMGVALAQEALEVMISYSRERIQFNQKIYNFQLIKGIIGNAITNIYAARALCMEAAMKRLDKHPDAIVRTSIAKYFSSKVANKVAADAVQVLGANGCIDHYPVERIYREAKILEIIEGSSQIQQQIIANYGLNKYYQPERIKKM